MTDGNWKVGDTSFVVSTPFFFGYFGRELRTRRLYVKWVQIRTFNEDPYVPVATIWKVCVYGP